MRELLEYLRANGFKTYTVSGGGVDFLRVIAEELYGVPPEQVVGSSIKTKYEIRHGQPVIVRLPEVDFIDDRAGKPVGIHKFIGKRPIAAFGNSDGDFEMLEWTTSATGARLGVLVHHDDAAREFTYDRTSHVGRLVRGLDEGPARGAGPWSALRTTGKSYSRRCRNRHGLLYQPLGPSRQLRWRKLRPDGVAIKRRRRDHPAAACGPPRPRPEQRIRGPRPHVQRPGRHRPRLKRRAPEPRAHTRGRTARVPH